jgi:Ni2+-binding GTPase involved in maturation of urease and hydrogenase
MSIIKEIIKNLESAAECTKEVWEDKDGKFIVSEKVYAKVFTPEHLLLIKKHLHTLNNQLESSGLTLAAPAAKSFTTNSVQFLFDVFLGEEKIRKCFLNYEVPSQVSSCKTMLVHYQVETVSDSKKGGMISANNYIEDEDALVKFAQYFNPSHEFILEKKDSRSYCHFSSFEIWYQWHLYLHHFCLRNELFRDFAKILKEKYPNKIIEISEHLIKLQDICDGSLGEEIGETPGNNFIGTALEEADTYYWFSDDSIHDQKPVFHDVRTNDGKIIRAETLHEKQKKFEEQ